MNSDLKTEPARDLDTLFATSDQIGLTPGWVNRGAPLFWPEPHAEHVPAAWDYASACEALDLAGELIDVELAERRNLIMRNPVPGNDFSTLRSFACAYQMILPGERARSHRHSPHALRVIIEGRGSYSVVNGEKVPMETGDVVLTPGGQWHGHGHDGTDPAYWMDVLDLPLVHLLEAMFYEDHPDSYEAITSEASQSPYRFPADWIAAELDAAPADPGVRPGPRITLPAPEMPSMGLTVERLPAGAETSAHRSTANRVFVVMSGEGRTTIGERAFPWRAGDTFVVPTWQPFAHHASSETTLFEVSDEPTMRALGYYREA